MNPSGKNCLVSRQARGSVSAKDVEGREQAVAPRREIVFLVLEVQFRLLDFRAIGKGPFNASSRGGDVIWPSAPGACPPFRSGR